MSDNIRDKCPQYSKEVLARGLTLDEIAIIHATVSGASTLEMTKGWGHMVPFTHGQADKFAKFTKR